jgi:hypothetical protein
MKATITTIILMTILAITLLVSYKSVMAKTDGSSGVPFAQDDRDRIIRFEEGQKSFQQQISDLRNLMYAAQRSIWNFLRDRQCFLFENSALCRQRFVMWGTILREKND